MLAPQRLIGTPVYVAIGAGSAVVGLLPWIITGMRLPLQNLWAFDTLPGDMPFALLPFSQYYASFTVALMLIGATIAGIVGRATTPRNRRPALFALLGGVLLVQAIALLQTAVTVANGLQIGVPGVDHGSAAAVYLLGLTAGIVVGILIGLGMLALIARAPRAWALIALSVAAVAFGSWIAGLLFPIGTVITASDYSNIVNAVVHYSPAIGVGAAIAWCGVQGVGRAIAAVVSLGILWVGPTLVTAVSSALGSRVLLPYPSEMLDYGVSIFRNALGMPDLWGTPLALALGIAVIGLVGRRTARTIRGAS